MSQLLVKVREVGLIYSFLKGGRDSKLIEVTHPLYAENTIIFVEVNEEQVKYLKTLMRVKVFIGLKVNFNKIEIIPVGKIDNSEESAIEFGWWLGSLPSTHLGPPLGASFKSIVM